MRIADARQQCGPLGYDTVYAMHVPCCNGKAGGGHSWHAWAVSETLEDCVLICEAARGEALRLLVERVEARTKAKEAKTCDA